MKSREDEKKKWTCSNCGTERECIVHITIAICPKCKGDMDEKDE